MHGLHRIETGTRSLRSVRLAGALPLLVMAACVSTESTPGLRTAVGDYLVGAPYRVDGIEFRPQESFSYDETGIAAVAPAARLGRPTANGEVFAPDGLVAAHPTLQLPALARVVNLANGRSVVVRVNDRGAFGDSLIEVSPRTADYLDFAGEGTAPVRVQLLPDESLALAQLAGRDGPAPAMAGSLRDPLVAAAAPLPEGPSLMPDIHMAPPPAGDGDPLMAGGPADPALPAAETDPLMAEGPAGQGGPPGPGLSTAPPPAAVGTQSADAALPAESPRAEAGSAEVAAAPTTGRSVRAVAVSGSRPSLSAVYADHVEATLLAPLLASADPVPTDPPAPADTRQADPPADIPALAASLGPADALAEALLARRLMADALVAADAELAAIAVAAGRGPDDAAPPVPAGAEETAIETIVRADLPVTETETTVVLRAGQAANETAAGARPSDAPAMDGLLALHGETLDGDSAPLDLAAAAPMRVFGNGPSIEVVTYILEAQEADAETPNGSEDGAPNRIAAPAEPTLLAEASMDAGGAPAAEIAANALVESGWTETASPPALPRADSAAAPAAGYFVQVGAFAVPANADRMQARLSEVGEVRFRRMTTSTGVQLTRVLIGPFGSHGEAEAMRTGAIDSGLVSDALIVQN
jgi:cell division protein FtsN